MNGADPTVQSPLVASEEYPIGRATRALDALRALWERFARLAIALGGRSAERAAALARELVRPRLMSQAIAASRRGNLDAAFALLREEVGERPGDPRSTLLFWGTALACERAPDAAAPMARLVRDMAAAGRTAEALDQWLALVGEVPGAVQDVATLARLVPVLRTRYSEARGEKAQQAARERLIDALRRCIDPTSGSLTPAIALRLVEESRGLEPDVARRAAEAALASPGLHEAKRARLAELVHALDAGRWPEPPVAPPPPPVRAATVSPPAPVRSAPAAAPAPVRAAPRPAPPSPAPARTASAASAGPAAPTAPAPAASAPPATSAPLARPAPAAAPLRASVSPAAEPAQAERRPAASVFAVAAGGALRTLEITPVELSEEGLVAWELAGEQRTRVHYRAIEAIATAEIADLGASGVIVIDLHLRATRPGRPRSSLRMRADAFDPAKLFPDRTDAGQALRALLSELLDRSGALPLPDPDSALAVRPQRYECLAAFEAAMLARLPG